MAAQAMENSAQPGSAGVCRGCKLVLFDFWRMRVRLGSDREGGRSGGRKCRNGRQRAANDLVTAAKGTTVHSGSGYGGRRSGWGLRVRAGDRADHGNAVCGVAWALSSVRTGAAGGGTGAQI